MPKYRVMFHGTKLEIPSSENGGDPVIGFYTTRIVTANDASDAKERGIENLLKEEVVRDFIKITRLNTSLEPTIEVERIDEVSQLQGQRTYDGFTLYKKE